MIPKNQTRHPRFPSPLLGMIAVAGLICAVISGTTVSRAYAEEKKDQDEEVVSVRVGEDGIFDYQLYLPKGLHDQKTKRPLLVFLHGGREVGKDVDELPLKDIKSYVGKALSVKTFPFIVAAPVTPTPGWKPEKVIAFIDKLMKEDKGRLNIDSDRVYLTGFSMGGFGTFHTACEYPDRFAAIVPVSGGGAPSKAEALQNVPTWAFHGDEDPSVPYHYTVDMIKRMKELKHPNVKFTTLEGCGHHIYKDVYSRPELYLWLLQHKRKVMKEAEKEKE